MSKYDKIREIIESWKAPRRLKEDTWQNVRLVLDYYGFTCERKKEWVCHHKEFTKLAQNPRAREILHNAGLGALGEFAIAVTHGTSRKAGMVIQRYLKIILKAIELLEVIQRSEGRS